MRYTKIKGVRLLTLLLCLALILTGCSKGKGAEPPSETVSGQPALNNDSKNENTPGSDNGNSPAVINAGAFTMLSGLVIVPVVSAFSKPKDSKAVENCFACYEQTTTTRVLQNLGGQKD